MTSIARCFAAAMSHAPGLSGTPDTGHCSSAATSASCASSSAMPTSRSTRVRPPMIFADSMRHTASTVRCTLDDDISLEAGTELAHLDRRPLRGGTFAGDREGLLLRLAVEQEEAPDQLFRLGE